MADDGFFDKYIIDSRELFSLNHKSRVLVIDDEPNIRGMVMDILHDSGFAVEGAGDGEQALERIRVSPPSAIILDLQMPRMGGVEMLKRLRNDLGYQGLRVIVFSAFVTPATEKVLRSYGVETILPKPFDVADVLAAVRNIFDQFKPQHRRSGSVCPRCGSTDLDFSATPLRAFLRRLTGSRKRYCKECHHKWLS